MANEFTSGLTALTLLGGDASLFTAVTSDTAATTVQTRAARLAKAQFTLPAISPPWKAASTVPESVSAVRRLKSIVDQVQSSATLPADLQTAFTAYKALDRLRVLAEFASKATTSTAERSQLQTSFAKGMADLQKYLAVSPSDQLTLSFGQPKSRADSIALPAANPASVDGAAVTSDRYAALSGLTGSERLTIKLSRPGASDALTVDLAQTAQPPTLDSVATALNAAIASIPVRDSNGALVLDADGNPRARWTTAFAVVKGDKGWGLELQTSGGEQVSLRDEAARDGLMVAASQTASGASAGVALTRFDLPGGVLSRASLGVLSAVDRQATAEQQLLPARKSPLDGTPVSAAPVPAAMSARAVVSDAQGFSYVVGTTSGDTAAQRGDRADDLLLTKVDAKGTVIWQRTLGSGGTAEGKAIALTSDGDVVVAATVNGDLDGASTDGDMMVMRFSAAGEERFATPIRAAGADRAQAVGVDSAGNILVGGKAADGTAMLARLDGSGKLLERQSLGTAGSEVRAIAAAPDGSSLVLLSGAQGASLVRMGAAGAGQLSQAPLGDLDVTSLAVSDDGSVAVGGNRLAGDRNGVVVQLGADLSVSATTNLASSGDDRVDSLAWLDGAIYAGGRTNGALGGAKAGGVDGFVAKIATDGSVAQVTQWGRSGTDTGPVEIAGAANINGAASALGFRSGLLNPPESVSLVDRTPLRAGDLFSFRIDGGKSQSITITAQDTLASLADRLSRLTAGKVKVATTKIDGALLLRFEAKAGHAVDLSAGPDGKDALAKLGLVPGRLVAPPAYDAKAPRVTPGGTYGLDLGEGLSIRDSALAAASLVKLNTAISTTQTAYRSLYWDDNKEALVNQGTAGAGTLSVYQSAQLAQYKNALARLTASTS